MMQLYAVDATSRRHGIVRLFIRLVGAEHVRDRTETLDSSCDLTLTKTTRPEKIIREPDKFVNGQGSQSKTLISLPHNRHQPRIRCEQSAEPRPVLLLACLSGNGFVQGENDRVDGCAVRGAETAS